MNINYSYLKIYKNDSWSDAPKKSTLMTLIDNIIIILFNFIVRYTYMKSFSNDENSENNKKILDSKKYLDRLLYANSIKKKLMEPIYKDVLCVLSNEKDKVLEIKNKMLKITKQT